MLIQALPLMSATEISLVIRLLYSLGDLVVTPGGVASTKAFAIFFMNFVNSGESLPYDNAARAVKLESSRAASSLYLLAF